MTGWRVAYLHSDESIVKEILKVHDSLVTCAPVISQYAAMGALEMGERDLNNFIVEYKQRRDYITQRLDTLSKVFEYVKPNSSYFVFPSFKPYLKNTGQQIQSWDFALKILKEANVALVPGMAFGPNGEGHLRFSFGRGMNDLEKAFNRLDNYFKNI